MREMVQGALPAAVRESLPGSMSATLRDSVPRTVSSAVRESLPGTLPAAGREPAGVVVAADYFRSYSVVGLLAVVGVLFVAVAFGAGRLLRPVVPTPEKLLTYECGVDPVGEGWAHTQVRYYVYAFLYVVFAVDSIFLFPWATVFAVPGYGATTLVEMFIFLGFLAVGLLYAYKKGVLAWT